MSDRLRLAVENGHVVLPDGNVLVVNPAPEADLSILDKATTEIWSRSARVHEALKSKGWRFNEGMHHDFKGAIVFLPREKDAQRAFVGLVLSFNNFPIIVDGDKSIGVERMYRDLRPHCEVSEAWSKAHGKVFTIHKGVKPDGWRLSVASRHEDGWWRGPGVFSADGIDPASALLAESLPQSLSGSVVDLGAGWGFLSHAILKREKVTKVHLVEDDSLALAAAELNAHWGGVAERAVFHHADALTWSPDTPVDHVVTNPPFHTGRAADPSLGQGFIRTAARILQRNGSLWLVANRQLPYESTLNDAFREVHLLKENAQFKVYRADRPRARRKG